MDDYMISTYFIVLYAFNQGAVTQWFNYMLTYE